uniref:dirigent protein 4-like n=1 Tax=Erigeron canadensis TaxID=72917 RepID=UPI001CB92359|nr:dirigent protein 4-like [Erigeron canadensis]
MGKIVIFAWLLVLVTATLPAVNSKYYSKTQTFDAPATLKKTHLHFFFHDTVYGANKKPSSILVAKPKKVVVQEGNIGPFGAVYVFDDPLTVGPDPKSEVIGNGRGMYASVSRGSDPTLLFNGDLEFTSGEFNGSSVSLFSRDPIFGVKEVAVVGGRGKFRMAKGFALLNTIFFNVTSGDAILEFHVTVIYY